MFLQRGLLLAGPPKVVLLRQLLTIRPQLQRAPQLSVVDIALSPPSARGSTPRAVADPEHQPAAAPTPSFGKMQLSPELLAALEDLNIKEPTEIQVRWRCPAAPCCPLPAIRWPPPKQCKPHGVWGVCRHWPYRRCSRAGTTCSPHTRARARLWPTCCL